MEKRDNETAALIEIYKAHTRGVDEVSRRRAMANRMHLAATTSVGITMGVVGRFGSGDVPVWIVEAGLGVLGMLIQAGWLGVIKSHRQLNQHKCDTLLELEKRLPFDFYQKEWDAAKGGKDPKVYLEATIAERTLPKCFMAAFAAATAVTTTWGIVRCLNG